MNNYYKSIFHIVIVLFLVFNVTAPAFAFQTTNQSYPVSQGVTYSNYTYSNNAVNHLAVDLENSYTKLAIGLPMPINTLVTTTAHANSDSKEGNRVVGAINSNFFNMGDGYPLYLLSQNNHILTPSVVSNTTDKYVNQPTAFGITFNGTAEIDYYNSKVVVNYKGENKEINGVNVTRGSNEAIVYTPQHRSSISPNNEYGIEYLIETSSEVGSTKFGQTMTGKVVGIRSYGDKTKPKILKNGFILSINGSKWNETYGNIVVGEEISVTFSIDDKWMDAQFIMASGPLLVRDGAVNIAMDTSSSRAREIAPRTAIAIDKSKKKVHLITVDGRQSGSVGMTLTQFANYLVSLGVDRAINLDGGGSTAMGIRKYGSNKVVLANNPSDGVERKVSAIIEAISTAPTGTAKTLKVTRSQVGTLLVGATVSLTPEYVLDEHYNALPMNEADFILTPTNETVSVKGLKYTAIKSGTERLLVQNGAANQTISFDVVDAPASLTIASTKTTIEPDSTMQFTVDAKDQNGGIVIYSPSQVKWSVEGAIGSIDATGKFVSNGKLGKGKISATLGTKTVSKDIEVKSMFNEPVYLINSFENLDEWRVENTLATGDITLENSSTIGRQGKSSIKLTYDMTGNTSGTAATYLRLKSLVQLPGTPLKMGVWMYGDSNGTWVRGQMRDANGQKYTIDFTENNGQTWTGWKYIEATLPKDVVYPYTFESIYLVQTNPANQKAGAVYFDQLQAVYKNDYVEPLFKDIDAKNPYNTEIRSLVNRGLISGYGDGTFKPNLALTRAHAAVLLTRALKLNTTMKATVAFSDVPATHPYAKEIAAIVNAGIMNGTGNGTFNPADKLTRAQMSKILVLAFNLKGNGNVKTFTDVNESHWSYDYVQTLAANGITTGYGDGTYKPNLEVSRVHFTLFKYRSLAVK